MREALVYVLALAITAYGSFQLGHYTKVPVTEEPKQSPYVIFIEVCGRPEYILITTDPVMGLARKDEVIPEGFDEALQSVPQERVIILTHWDTYCTEPDLES